MHTPLPLHENMDRNSAAGEVVFYCWQCGKAQARRQVCGRCACAVYCSAACQGAAWISGHKEQCAHLLSLAGHVQDVSRGSGHRLCVGNGAIVACVALEAGVVAYEGLAYMFSEDDLLCRDLYNGSAAADDAAARAVAWHRHLTVQEGVPQALQDMVTTGSWASAALLSEADQPASSPGVVNFFGLAVGRESSAEVNAEWDIVPGSVRVPTPPPFAGRLQTHDRPTPPLQTCTLRATTTQAIARGTPLCVRPKPAVSDK
jgi:hypothetical protein